MVKNNGNKCMLEREKKFQEIIQSSSLWDFPELLLSLVMISNLRSSFSVSITVSCVGVLSPILPWSTYLLFIIWLLFKLLKKEM